MLEFRCITPSKPLKISCDESTLIPFMRQPLNTRSYYIIPIFLAHHSFRLDSKKFGCNKQPFLVDSTYILISQIPRNIRSSGMQFQGHFIDGAGLPLHSPITRNRNDSVTSVREGGTGLYFFGTYRCNENKRACGDQPPWCALRAIEQAGILP